MPLHQESSHLTRLSITKLYAQSPVCARACVCTCEHACV